MNIALIDDMKMETERLEKIIKEYAVSKHISISLDCFANAEDLLSGYRPLTYTLIFMDIYMDGMDGINAARAIRKIDKDTLIVFLTTSAEHTFEAFDVHAYHYIVKPVKTEKLQKSIICLLDEIIDKQDLTVKKLSFTFGGSDRHIPYPDILYAQSNRHYMEIIDKEHCCYRPRITFSKILEQLSEDNRFLQINRGILINMDYITDFADGICVLDNKYRLPVSVRERKHLDQIRKNYVFGRIHHKINEGKTPYS